jgi:hypothetical protein
MDRRIKQQRACAILDTLRASLDLSREDVGTMVGSSGETVRAWEDGDEEVPDLVFGRLVSAHAALNRLRDVFRPERLPQVIPRRAPVFASERALEWILDGRIEEVAQRYEQGLAYGLPRPA